MALNTYNVKVYIHLLSTFYPPFIHLLEKGGAKNNRWTKTTTTDRLKQQQPMD